MDMQNITVTCRLSIVFLQGGHIYNTAVGTSGWISVRHIMCRCFCVGISPNMKPPCFDWYLSSITPNREHIKRLLHLAPLEFHHREDLPQPPSLVATVLSRSTFDLTEVSLSHLPVIAVIEFAFQCLSPEDLLRCSLMWLVRTGQQKESI